MATLAPRRIQIEKISLMKIPLMKIAGHLLKRVRYMLLLFGACGMMNAAESGNFVLIQDQAGRNDLSLSSKVKNINILLDRSVYADFMPWATGRVRLETGGGLPLQNQLQIVAHIKGSEEKYSQKLEGVTSSCFDFDLSLQSLKPGEYELELEFLDGDQSFAKATVPFRIEHREAKTSGEISVTTPAAPADASAWPYTFGVPFPIGALSSPENVQLLDEKGGNIPIETRRVCDWTKNGSIKWLLVDAILPVSTSQQKYRIVYGPSVETLVPAEPVQLSEIELPDGRDAIVVETGRLKFEIPKTLTPGIHQLWDSGRAVAKPDPESGPYVVDQDGTRYFGSLDPSPEVVVESRGPLKASIRITGWHVSKEGNRLGKFVMRFVAHAGLPQVQVSHTFIVTEDTNKVAYKDIGYAFPTTTSEGVFGTPRVTPFRLKEEKDANAYLLQVSDQRSEVVVDGVFVDEAGRSEGWVSNNAVTMSVRDFWQQFPKELEVTPSLMIAHAWPAHNGPAVHGKDKTSLYNAHMFWFCHEGELLSFKPPQWFGDLTGKEDAAYSENMMTRVNAIGLAKTHDLLLTFHAVNWEQGRARTANTIFQYHPMAICDPDWVAATEVMGKIAPRDPEKFPKVEAVMDGMISSILRQQEEDRDYGMFNFGNAHHDWNRALRRWDMHRLWRATHHNWPRWPWLQFARSGDKKIFDYARQNGRHVADISHCHFTNEEFAKVKVVGGICDYKGIVHWASGNRFCYNSVADSMLDSYYFTGDHRSLTTALEFGASLLENPATNTSREGSGRIISAIALYYHTWNNDYLEFIDRTIRSYEVEQQEDGSFSNFLVTWTPHFQRYYDLTENPRGLKILKRYGELALSNPEYYVHKAYIFGQLNYFGWLYQNGGDKRFLTEGAWQVNSFRDTLYKGEDKRFLGAPTWPRNMEWSWFLNDAPVYLKAISKKPEILDSPRQTTQGVRVLSREDIDGQRWWTTEARLRQEKDEPFILEVREVLPNTILEIKALDVPDAKTLRFEAPALVEWKKEGRIDYAAMGLAKMKTSLKAEIPRDGARQYAVRVRCDTDFVLPLPLVAQQDQVKEVYPLNQAVLIGGAKFWLDLPPAAKSFDSQFIGDDFVSKIEIFNGAGEPIYSEVFNAGNGGGIFSLPVSGSPLGWSFRFVGNKGTGSGGFHYPNTSPDGKPLWFAASKDRFFWPDDKESAW